jgi:hypothetical protein
MPRNSSGIYTLPTGNPVVDGTIIDVEWANPTMEDIGNEITNSLPRNGTAPMTGPLLLVRNALSAMEAVTLNQFQAHSLDTTSNPHGITPTMIGAAKSGPLASSGITGAAASGDNIDITSLDSPELNSATATTQTGSDSSTKVATTEFVSEALANSKTTVTFVTPEQYGAIGNGIADDAGAIQLALDTGKTVRGDSNKVYLISAGVTLQAGQIFDLNGSTLKAASTGINMVKLNNYSIIANGIIDGVYKDDVLGGAGVVFLPNVISATAQGVRSINHGFHGFASSGTDPNTGCFYCLISNCQANDCGHRGINLSAGSSFNRISNFSSKGCKRAGVLLGYLCHSNVIDNVIITDCHNAGIWTHMQCFNNQYSNVSITDPNAAGVDSPGLLVGAHCYKNQYSNFVISGHSRGMLLWNQAVDNPQLGVVDGLLEHNSFMNFKITGDPSVPVGSMGLSFQGDAAHTTNSNVFSGMYITNFEAGIRDASGFANAEQFRDITFGNITSRKFRFGGNANNYRNSRLFNVEGVTDIGSLALTTTDFEAAPSVPASGVAVTQCYPFPVTITQAGMGGTFGAKINGVSVNGTLSSDGQNGPYRVQPGQTITLDYTSGTPTWRWFT